MRLSQSPVLRRNLDKPGACTGAVATKLWMFRWEYTVCPVVNIDGAELRLVATRQRDNKAPTSSPLSIVLYREVSISDPNADGYPHCPLSVDS